MRDRLSSKKFILAILGLIVMVLSPEVAAYVVSLLVPVILGISAIDYKKESNKSKE
jgi:hypothetical protein